ncbi:MAG TPA: carboxypeptidase M32 [Acidobacteriota bacterium]|jgi:carboxypeptidase Taq
MINSDYARFLPLVQEIYYLRTTAGLLSWDQETMMPPKAAEIRAKQLATLSSLHHQKLTSPEFGDLLGQLETQTLEADAQVVVREMGRDFRRAVTVPTALVKEISETTSLAYNVWNRARIQSDFEMFAPWLKKIIRLKTEEAHCLGFEKNLYDAHLDDYEPGLTAESAGRLFALIREQVIALVDGAVAASNKHKDDGWLSATYPTELQRSFGHEIVDSMGIDWQGGRMDVSPHPFCSGNGPTDVRITTRYNENDFLVSLFGIIHEAGHALYEQGLDVSRFGTPLCDTVSLGIHESQSRLWENLVGRSREFWEHWFPRFQKTFPNQTRGLEFDQFYGAINKVERSLIRVDADELTYNLHVILRFELEQAIFEGQLSVDGLEEAWNQKMKLYLDRIPPDSAHGVLQDVHWASGLIGYFPTYLLGNVYAAQFHLQAKKDIPDLTDQIRSGNLMNLREWLRKNIHLQGKRYSASDLVRRVTGEPPNPKYFIDYLKQKFSTNADFGMRNAE